MFLLKSIIQNASLRLFALLGTFISQSFDFYCRPSTSETEDIIKLIDAGMSVARFNMTHGTIKVIFNHFSFLFYSKMQDCLRNTKKRRD